jgi:hypothetical protein
MEIYVNDCEEAEQALSITHHSNITCEEQETCEEFQCQTRECPLVAHFYSGLKTI